MIEIKTIIKTYPDVFDTVVNEELKNGWDLVKRECFITGADRATTFYAELERFIDEPELEDENEEFDLEDTSAAWLLQRDPVLPYRCSKCGYKTNRVDRRCPSCLREMRIEFE